MKTAKTKDLTKEDLAKIINAQTKVEVRLEKENEELRKQLKEHTLWFTCKCDNYEDDEAECVTCLTVKKTKALLEKDKI